MVADRHDPRARRKAQPRPDLVERGAPLGVLRDVGAQRADARGKRMAEISQRQEQLQPRIREERDLRNAADLDARLGEAIGNGALGELLGLLVAGEALLLRRRDDSPVADDGRRGIVGAEVEPEDESRV
jgi:hypothetical protein